MQKKYKLSGDALTIAEGEGRNAVFLAEQGMNVTAWDYAENGMAKTKKLAHERKVDVQTKLVDLNEASWEKNKWDEIVCIFGHFPSELRQKTLKGVKEAVKPGGYYITEVYSLHQFLITAADRGTWNSYIHRRVLLQTFGDWRIVHFFMGEVVRHEGELHNGLAHVIQFAGQKP